MTLVPNTEANLAEMIMDMRLMSAELRRASRERLVLSAYDMDDISAAQDGWANQLEAWEEAAQAQSESD